MACVNLHGGVEPCNHLLAWMDVWVRNWKASCTDGEGGFVVLSLTWTLAGVIFEPLCVCRVCSRLFVTVRDWWSVWEGGSVNLSCPNTDHGFNFVSRFFLSDLTNPCPISQYRVISGGKNVLSIFTCSPGNFLRVWEHAVGSHCCRGPSTHSLNHRATHATHGSSRSMTCLILETLCQRSRLSRSF